MPTMFADCLWQARCTLGEGCVWDASRERLLFVDVRESAVLSFTPSTGRQQRWPMPEMIGWLVPRARGGWVAGLASGVAGLDWHDDAAAPTFTWLHRLHPPGSPMRLNDGRADAQGRLWFGTMNHFDEHQPVGRFYRFDPDGSLHLVDEGYCVTNGPTFSRDGRTLFHTDTVARRIYAFDVDQRGELQRKRIWKQVDGPESEEGYPDGMCTDAEDHLWVARWGAGCVTRLDPEGREVARIHTGAPRTTNCAFGGATLTDLYVTTARFGLDEHTLSAAPQSGGLFLAHAGCRGVAPAVWGG